MTTYGDVTIRINANASPFVREMAKARAAVTGLGDDIDTTNDRTAWLAQGFMALAPALAPLGAAAVPILSGIATQATVGVAAIGTMALAFSGLGDALKALNDYQLEPTAENFMAMQSAMEKLGPDGADFVRFLDDVGSKLSVLKLDAREGMFPGLTEGIESALELLPRMRTLVSEIAGGLGQLAAEGGAGLAGPEFREFFRYLETDARDILVDMGRTIGNFVDGFGSMLVAFGPLTGDFSDGFLQMSRSFEQWAEELAGSTDFQAFVEYVRDAGPKATELLGALSDAFVQLVEAAAPIGDVALPVLETFFELVAAIADTPVGSLLILTGALTGLYGRFQALRTITTGGVMGPMTTGLRESTNAARAAIPTFNQWGTALGSAARSQAQLKQNMLSGIPAYEDAARKASQARFAVGNFARAIGPAAGAAGLMAVSMTGVADSVGLGNTALGAAVGLMATGGPWGAAIGAGIGLTADLASSYHDLGDAADQAHEAMKTDRLDVLGAAATRLRTELEGVGTTQMILNSTLGALPAVWGGETWIERYNELGGTLSDVEGRIRWLQTALKGQGWDTTGMELYYEGLGITGDRARIAAMGVDQFTRAVARSLGILTKQGDFDAYQEAIDNARKGVAEFGRTLDANTNAGRENRSNLRALAESALTFSENLRGLERADFLRGAAEQFIKTARSMGMSERAAERLAERLFFLDRIEASPKVQLEDKEGRRKVREMMRELGLLDGRVAEPSVALLYQQFQRGKITVEQMMRFLNGLRANPHVGADTSEATSKIHGVISLLSTVRDKTVHITTVFARKNIELKAEGGLISGPGGPRDDVIPIMASNREYIIKAAAVEKYGVAMFDAFNSMAAPAPAGGPRGMAAVMSANRFANGGPVRAQASGGGGVSRSVIEVRVSGEMDLRRATAQIRQMAGDVSRVVAADEYDQRETFRRTQYGDQFEGGR